MTKQQQIKDMEDSMTIIVYQERWSYKALKFMFKYLGCQGKGHIKANNIYLYGKDHINEFDHL